MKGESHVQQYMLANDLKVLARKARPRLNLSYYRAQKGVLLFKTTKQANIRQKKEGNDFVDAPDSKKGW